MLRLLIMLIIAFFPMLVFSAIVIWALGHFGYTPLAPLSNSISAIVQPYIQPILDMIKGLLSRLPGNF